MSRRITPTGWSIRWDEARAATAYRDGWWDRHTCAAALFSAADQDPKRVVIRDGATDLRADWLLDQARRLAGAMLERAAPGSVVSFMLPNWHEAAIVYMAATLAGMVAHPILPSLRDRELRFMLADVRSRMIFVPERFRGHEHAAMLARLAAEMDVPPMVVTVRGAAAGTTPFGALLDREPARDLPDVDPDDVRMVMYTSGTTGRPKGVLHTHNSLGALIRQIGRHWMVEPGDSFLVASPISHIGGSIYAFECPVLLGATAVLAEHWDAAEAVTLIERHGITHMAGATPFLNQLLSAAREAGTRLPSLKVFICGGASVPPALIREASGWFARAAITRVYGSTEVPVTTVGVIDRRDIDHASETDGLLGIATVSLAHDREIRAAGPQMLAGYLHSEDEDDAFDEAGCFRTGDQGCWVDGDHLVVAGRIKDIIIRNGENISPKEVEDLLAALPAIEEVAIVGVPDPRTGERAVAVLVPKMGVSPSVGDLSAYLSGLGVARFKHPEAVVSRPALPKNDAGKVLKHALRAELASGANRPDDARAGEDA